MLDVFQERTFPHSTPQSTCQDADEPMDIHKEGTPSEELRLPFSILLHPPPSPIACGDRPIGLAVATMHFSLLAASFLAATVAAAQPKLQDYEVFERLDAVPPPWVLKDGGQVDADQGFKLRIHLKNRNTASFQKQVYDISTPGHPSYGRHMSREEVNAMLAPSKESFDVVSAWLEAQGLSKVATIENDWIVVDSTVGDVEELLQTEYHLYKSTQTGKTTVRTTEYSLPSALHAHVDIIAPTIKFSTPSAQKSMIIKDMTIPASQLSHAGNVHDGLNATACNSTITPDCIAALYKFKNFRGSRRNGNSFALAGFLEEYAQHDDLAQFLATYEPKAVGSDFSEVLINGGLNTQQNTTNVTQEMGEANLDIQYGLALAYPTPTLYFSTGGRPPETTPTEVDNEPYLQFLTYLLNMTDIPQTISISYGDGETTVPVNYANTVCNLFAQVAARGVSVLVSSGDSGSGSDCSVQNPSKFLYSPAFPAECPFVTAVGATYRVEPEIAVSFSGGGFSNFFPRPAYQDAAVTTYLNEYARPNYTQYFNASGRAYPDISAQGVYFHVINTGVDTLESGTSASAPTYASVIALLNSDRISNGLPPFGFLNPWLYSNASSAHTDITGGKSSGCTKQIPGSGFPATVGWDPVTGLGTPDFKKLRLASTGIES